MFFATYSYLGKVITAIYMKKAFHLLLSATLCLVACSQGPVVTGDWDVLPKPKEVTLTPETSPFVLERHLQISYEDPSLATAADLLAADLKTRTGHRCKVLDSNDKNVSQASAIVLRIDPSAGEHLSAEKSKGAYRLEVNPDRVILSGATVQGVLNGCRTLCKALPATASGETPALPAARVRDWPYFDCRGFMLDVSRHFFDAATVKEVIDILALHNLNVFHWHLTDDQGWRIPIDAYPELTKKGSWRAGTPSEADPEDGVHHDGIPVSGAYTKDEIRDVVRYAEERGITVIPEIDLPGHMMAALAAYPELGCTGGPYEVATRYGVLDDVLCAGKEATFTFIKAVLEEVMDLFPSEYIHLGGDECPKVRWEACPDCQAKIRQLDLKDADGKSKENRLQSWLMDEAAGILAARGRKMIAWNDVLCDWGDSVCGTPSTNIVIAGWMRPSSTRIAAKEGYPVIFCPCGYLYFSAREFNALPVQEALERVYDMPSLFDGLTEAEADRILGMQACIWSERVADREDMQWKMLPRLAALAELSWTGPFGRDKEDFLKRLDRLEATYSARGWNWRRE